MAIKYNGLHFIPTDDGGVTIQIGHNATENSDVLREAHLSPEEWAEISASIAPVVEAPVDTTPGPVSSVTSAEAIELIKMIATLEELDKLQADEESSQRHPGGRKGVLDALMKRRDELNEQE